MKRGKGVRQHGKTAKTRRGGMAIEAVRRWVVDLANVG